MKAFWASVRRPGNHVRSDIRVQRKCPENIESCTQFDARFDRFWEESRARHPHRLLAARDVASLEWHLGEGLRRGDVTVLAIADSDRIASYATFCRKDEPEYGLRRLRLVDFQSVDENPSHLLHLLQRARRDCRPRGIHVLENIGWKLEPGDLMHRIAPFQRKLDCWRYCYKVGDPAIAAKLEDRETWDPTSYDGDSSFDWRAVDGRAGAHSE